MKLQRALLWISLALCVTACDRVAPVSTPATSGTTAGAEIVVGEHDRWQAGVHYEIVQPLAEVTAANGQVTVVEFFWYGCPHCYKMDPYVTLWKRKKPQNVAFQRIPATWGPYDRPHAQLFYTLQALGRTDLHAIIFDTIHGQGNRLAADDEQETLRLQLEFAGQHGIDTRQFMDAYNSAEVAAHLQSAERLSKHYQVAKLPTLLVNGKYKTDVSRTDRNAEALMRLIGDLTLQESSGEVAKAARN